MIIKMNYNKKTGAQFIEPGKNLVKKDKIKNSPLNKLKNLRKILSEMKNILVAFSGGVDSTFLLKVAQEELNNRIVAVTAKSEIHPLSELSDARRIAQKWQVRHIIIAGRELLKREFVDNSLDRCYFCKRELLKQLKEIAQKYNLNYVVDGSNYDDLDDYRPGRRALKELNIRSPLQEAYLTKNDIRILSKKMGLETWGKPSNSCLATRIPYGEKITIEKLKKIEQAEEFIQSLGIKQVRVRFYNNLARIEVKPKDFMILLEDNLREKIINKFNSLGFIYITLDLQGYRTGSMDREIK
jgi:uncharacterized protein